MLAGGGDNDYDSVELCAKKEEEEPGAVCRRLRRPTPVRSADEGESTAEAAAVYSTGPITQNIACPSVARRVP